MPHPAASSCVYNQNNGINTIEQLRVALTYSSKGLTIYEKINTRYSQGHSLRRKGISICSVAITYQRSNSPSLEERTGPHPIGDKALGRNCERTSHKTEQ